jgi:hypothetical protein
MGLILLVFVAGNRETVGMCRFNARNEEAEDVRVGSNLEGRGRLFSPLANGQNN